MVKKIAVVLSGCGFKDGTEITEAVSTLINLSQYNVDYDVFAPDVEFVATNHINNNQQENRNVMAEAARISRGKISPLSELKAKNFDGVVFPGGFGAAQHLCTWAVDGASCTVLSDAARVINEFYHEGKPITAICIAPALVAKVLGQYGVNLTIGNDKKTATEIEKTGALHVECAVDDYVTDREHKVITTPAYMYEESPHHVFKGISGAIKEFIEMA